MTQPTKKIWVEVQTTRGINELFFYRGLLDVEEFNGWVTGRLTKNCIKLERTYWI